MLKRLTYFQAASNVKHLCPPLTSPSPRSLVLLLLLLQRLTLSFPALLLLLVSSRPPLLKLLQNLDIKQFQASFKPQIMNNVKLSRKVILLNTQITLD